MSLDVLGGVADVLERGGEPDDLLRGAVEVLAEHPRLDWAGIAFLEDGDLVLGPSAGSPDAERRHRVGVDYEGAQVGELWVDGVVDRALLERVAALLAAHVLIGWDTGGQTWRP